MSIVGELRCSQCWYLFATCETPFDMQAAWPNYDAMTCPECTSRAKHTLATSAIDEIYSVINRFKTASGGLE